MIALKRAYSYILHSISFTSTINIDINNKEFDVSPFYIFGNLRDEFYRFYDETTFLRARKFYGMWLFSWGRRYALEY